MLTEDIQLCDQCWERIHHLKRLKESCTSQQVDELGDQKPRQVIEDYVKAGLPLIQALEECCGKTRTRDALVVFWLYM